MTKIQRVVAGLIVFNEKGEVLLQKRKDTKIPEADGKWEIPGGKIEFGESPEDAARREYKEETGCDAEVLGLVDVKSQVWKLEDGSELQAVFVVYKGKYLSGTPEVLDDKVSEVRWLSLDEVGGLDALPGDKELVRQASLQ